MPLLIKTGFEGSQPLGVTSAGVLYYSVWSGGSRSTIKLASVDPSTGQLTSSAVPLSTHHGESDALPRWSVDGKYLAYLSLRGQRPLDTPVLVIRSAETGQVRELRLQLRGNGFLNYTWSPDGRSLLAAARDFKEREGIFQIDVQTGAVSPVLLAAAEGEVLRGAIWSKDGRHFYYMRDQVEHAFIERDITTGTEREIIRRPILWEARLFPNEEYIAATSADTATNSRTIILIPTAGGEPRVLMAVPSGVDPQNLSRNNLGTTLTTLPNHLDGHSILVVKNFHDEKKPNELWQVTVDGGSPVRIGIWQGER